MGCILSRLGSYSSPALAADGSALLGSSVAASNADAWLTGLGLGAYASAFQQAGYVDADILAQLEERDLDQIQQFTGTIIKPGHRKKILLCSRQRAKDNPGTLPVATPVTPAEWQRDSTIPPSSGREPCSNAAAVQPGANGVHGDRIPGQVNEPTVQATGLAPGDAESSSNDTGCKEHHATSAGTLRPPPASDPQLEGLPVLPPSTFGTLVDADQHRPSSGEDVLPHMMPAPLGAPAPPHPGSLCRSSAANKDHSNNSRIVGTTRSTPCTQPSSPCSVCSVDAAQQPHVYGSDSGASTAANTTAARVGGDAEAQGPPSMQHTDSRGSRPEPCSQVCNMLQPQCSPVPTLQPASAGECGAKVQPLDAPPPRPPPPSAAGSAASTHMQLGATGSSIAATPATRQGAGPARLCLLGQGFSSFMVQLAPDCNAAPRTGAAPSCQLPTSTTTPGFPAAATEPAAISRATSQRPDEQPAPCVSVHAPVEGMTDSRLPPTTSASSGHAPSPDMRRQPSEPAAGTPVAAAAPSRAQSAGSKKPSSKDATNTPASHHKHKHASSAAASRRHSAVQASLAWATAAPGSQLPLPVVNEQQAPDQLQAELLKVHSKVTQQLAALVSDAPCTSPSPSCSGHAECPPTGPQEPQLGDSMGSIAASIQARVTRLQQGPASAVSEQEMKQAARLPSGNLMPLALSPAARLPGSPSWAGRAAMAGETTQQHVLEVLNSRKHRLGAQLAAAPEQQQASPHAHAVPQARSVAAGSAMSPQLAAVQEHISKRVKHLDYSA